MIIDLDPQHFEMLKPQPAQAAANLTCKNASALIAGGVAKACLDRDGHVVSVAGLFELWPGRGMAWAIFGERIGVHMVSIVRECRDKIVASNFHRVEMYLVRHDDCAAERRLARMLGFRYECTAVACLPNGNDADVYVWIRQNSQPELQQP